jgi:glycine cleavage system H protein
MDSWGGCAIPDDRLYDLEADVWVLVENQAVRLGMTDVAQTRMGRMVQMSWKAPGRKIERGRPLSVLESSKWVGPLISPVTGRIIANNQDSFLADIAIANRDPYGDGWLYLVEPADIGQLKLLSSGTEVFEHYKRLIDENGIRCFRCVD